MTTTRKPSRQDLVLAALRAAGSRGATTAELCGPLVGGIRFGGRIKELRDMGHEIAATYERPGSHRYVLAREATTSTPDQQPDPPPAPADNARGADDVVAVSEQTSIFDLAETRAA